MSSHLLSQTPQSTQFDKLEQYTHTPLDTPATQKYNYPAHKDPPPYQTNSQTFHKHNYLQNMNPIIQINNTNIWYTLTRPTQV